MRKRRPADQEKGCAGVLVDDKIGLMKAETYAELVAGFGLFYCFVGSL